VGPSPPGVGYTLHRIYTLDNTGVTGLEPVMSGPKPGALPLGYTPYWLS
jgi:hypothetical protein